MPLNWPKMNKNLSHNAQGLEVMGHANRYSKSKVFLSYCFKISAKESPSSLGILTNESFWTLVLKDNNGSLDIGSKYFLSFFWPNFVASLLFFSIFCVLFFNYPHFIIFMYFLVHNAYNTNFFTNFYQFSSF